MEPPHRENGKIPVIAYNLGGCYVNLITAAIFFSLSFLLSAFPVAAGFAKILALTGLGFAILNGIPLRLGVDNDGYNALSLGKNPEAMESFRIQLLVNGENTRGVRLKDMPEDWFEMPEDTHLDNSMTVLRAVLRENRLMDQKKFQEAQTLGTALLSRQTGLPEMYRYFLTMDMVYCALVRNGDKAVLEKLQEKNIRRFFKSMAKYPAVIRTEYVSTLFREGEGEKTQALVSRLEQVAKHYPYPEELEGERELMQYARTLWEQKQ